MRRRIPSPNYNCVRPRSQIAETQVEKLSILSKQELVAICLRNKISVTGEKRALAARILRKLGPVFTETEEPETASTTEI